jgi:hypothetical protein
MPRNERSGWRETGDHDDALRAQGPPRRRGGLRARRVRRENEGDERDGRGGDGGRHRRRPYEGRFCYRVSWGGSVDWWEACLLECLLGCLLGCWLGCSLAADAAFGGLAAPLTGLSRMPKDFVRRKMRGPDDSSEKPTKLRVGIFAGRTISSGGERLQCRRSQGLRRARPGSVEGGRGYFRGDRRWSRRSPARSAGGEDGVARKTGLPTRSPGLPPGSPGSQPGHRDGGLGRRGLPTRSPGSRTCRDGLPREEPRLLDEEPGQPDEVPGLPGRNGASCPPGGPALPSRSPAPQEGVAAPRR